MPKQPWIVALVAVAGCSTAARVPSDAASADEGAPACPGASESCDDVCIVGACSFAVTAIVPVSDPTAPALDWVSGGAFFAISGHGFQPGMRVFLGTGRAPVRVIDAEHATIQAPPSTAGIVDVRLELGSETTRSLGLFEYRTSSIVGTALWEKRLLSMPHAITPSISMLVDGRALITGGYSDFTPHTISDSADVFSPATQTAAPSANAMHTQRWNHVSVTLLTGKTAIFGASGVGAGACCDSLIVDLFDPASRSFARSAAVPAERFQGPRAVLLVDGRVLVMSYGTTEAQIYDPEADSFTTVGGGPVIDYYQVTGNQYLTRLRDGRVLVVTGQGHDAWYFDSDLDMFTRAGPGPAAGPDGLHTLPDGRAIAIGGTTVEGGDSSVATATIELFDPSAGLGFVPAPYVLRAPRVLAATALERDGSLLVIGGATGSFPIPYTCGTSTDERPTAAVDRIDPVGQVVTAFTPLPEPNSFLVATTLLDGSAVAAGGVVCGVGEPNPYLYFRAAPPIL